ncbi:YheT family hydrolase [Arcticibacterium luteifluviistationis]|uniref:YheT family hydrolase n=1 Tax=Arcticibacterium luteifluviistationis TaxID=1784714 RepID=UPI001E55F0EE|nr:alpha/beta fold hydrolase [Arcticibacterium luteifluviistationis]
MKTSFSPPFWQFEGHLQTIYPSFFRKISLSYEKERLELEDGDFLDLEWLNNDSDKLILVTHGLEGDASRHYVTGMIQKFHEQGFDGLGWNCRSCSGEMNRLPKFYHHGDAEDLRAVMEYAIKKKGYKEVVLAGFSMGGSLTLRLVAEKPELLPVEVKLAAVASVPLDLRDSVEELQKPIKRFYMDRFLRKLEVKIKQKSVQFPDNDFFKGEAKTNNFFEFDGKYTAPLHGYKDAFDFYAKASAKPLLNRIKVPTLIVQALNDPFLGDKCFDLGKAESNSNLKLLLPKEGGHVGFMQSGQKSTYVEDQALSFYHDLKKASE